MAQPLTISGYEVVGPLGRGGMARVFEVRHPDLPGRRLALKLVAPARTGDRILRRFEREAQLLARVRHTGLVAVHAYGRSSHGPWLVMDLVEGEPLDQRLLARGPLDPRQAATIVAEVAEAVAALHAHGILHRDVKPDNVVLRADGRPVLLDLGVARADDSARLTETGTLVGSPQFMAPEQADGSSPDALSAAVDVYGLGALLFALLSGRPPVEDAPTLLEVVRRVVEDEPRWPSGERPVPAPLEAILRRAMAKRPADRHPGAGALAEALRGWLRESSPGRTTPAGEARPLAIPGAHRARLLGAALAGLGGLALLLVVALRSPQAEPRAGDPTTPAAPTSPTAGPDLTSPSAPGHVGPGPSGRPGPLYLPHPGAEAAGVGAVLLPGARALTWRAPEEGEAPLPASQLALWSLSPPGPARRERTWDVPGQVGTLAVDGAGVAWFVVVGTSGRGLFRLDPARDRAPAPLALPERPGAITALAVDAGAERVALAWQETGQVAEVVVSRLRGDPAPVTLRLPDDARISAMLFLPAGSAGELALAGGGVPPHTSGQREWLGHGGISVWRLPPAVPAPERVSLTGTTNQALSLARDPDGRLWAGNSYGFLGEAAPQGHLETLPGRGLEDARLPGLDPLMSSVPSHRGPVTAIVSAPDPARWLLAGWAHQPRWLYSLSVLVPRHEAERRVARPHELRAWRLDPGGRWSNSGGVLDWPTQPRTLSVTADGDWLLIGTWSRAELWPAALVRDGFHTWRELAGD